MRCEFCTANFRRNEIPGLAQSLQRCRDEGRRDLKDGDVVVQLEASLADVDHSLNHGTSLLDVVLTEDLFGHPQCHLGE